MRVEDKETHFAMRFELTPRGTIVQTRIECPLEGGYQEPSPEVRARLMALAEEETKEKRERLHRERVDTRHNASTHWINK